MTATPKPGNLFTSPLQIGYRQKGRDMRIAKTPELTIQPGDFICLLGPNGSGKTTLIRTLAGLQAPLQGTVTLGDQTCKQLSPIERARRISVVLTEMPSLGMIDAYSLVALGRHPHSGRFGTLGPKDKERIDWTFRAVAAESLKNCQVSQLSDGERQKLLIARALAQETPFLLLDEPTAFLDLSHQMELMITLRNLAHQERMGILFSTHNLDLALRSADRVWLLDKEGTITQGYPETLALNGALSRSFSGDGVLWDATHGIFRNQPDPNLKATVQGEGAHALWTKHALERLGFTMVEDADDNTLQVEVTTSGNQTEWRIEHKGHETCHTSIEAFVGWTTQTKLLVASSDLNHHFACSIIQT